MFTFNIFDTVVATQDWHPSFHCSFEKWPIHCLAGSYGAEFHNALDTIPINIIFHKGMNKNIDSYSAFYDNNKNETGLAKFYIPDVDIEYNQEFYVCGIATEICVKATIIDCKKSFDLNNNKFFIIFDACASITEKGEKETISYLKENSIKIINSGKILK